MKIKEGLAEIEIPGKAERKLGFYNPEMRENRDISVATLKIFEDEFEEKAVLDGFSATGIRSIRYCKETGWKPVATEVNEEAFSLLLKNRDSNNCAFRAESSDCKQIMMSEKFQAIDIDPYGSPAQFIYPAFSGLDKKSILMATATDTANLFGVYPKKSFRLYGYKGSREFAQKDIGIRMLLSFIMKTGAMMGKAYLPLLSYSYKHYVRVIGLVERSRKRANEILSEFRKVGDEKYYMGKLQNSDFLEKLKRELSNPEYSDSARALVEKISAEIDVPFYYDTHKFGAIPLKTAEKLVVATGGKFSRTHLIPTGFKTDLKREKVEELMGKWKKS